MGELFSTGGTSRIFGVHNCDPSGINYRSSSSLNTRHTVGRIVAMPLQVNRIRPAGGMKARVQELLEIVGLNP